MQNLYEHQTKLVEQISAVKKGGMVVFISGPFGKSSWINEYIKQMKPFRILSERKLNKETWFRISCNLEIANYIKSTAVDPTHYHEINDITMPTGRYRFDVQEQLMTLIGLIYTK